MRIKRAVLTYLSERFSSQNLQDLKAAFVAADVSGSQKLSVADFQLVMQKCGAYVGDYIFKELCEELDMKKTGMIPY